MSWLSDLLSVPSDYKSPDSFETYLKLIDIAVKHFEYGDYSKALTMFNAIVEKYPDFPLALQYRAMCKFMLIDNQQDILDTMADFRSVADSIHLVDVLINRFGKVGLE